MKNENINKATCGGDAQFYTYNNDGLPDSKTDFNGNVTKFEYDSDGLPVKTTEAFSTGDERIISKEWHPVLRKPVKITSPLSITEYTYDDMGRVIGRIQYPAQ